MKARILLVDDETALREAVTDLLVAEGYEVVAVDDGQVALQALAESSFDLIVADIVMPRLDGWGLLQAVRSDARYHELPFVFLTARGQAADARHGRDLGADDYLPKPFHPMDLLAIVRNRLRRRNDVASLYQDEVARLTELNRIKDEFVALTSHELARPLTAIRGFAELLLRSADTVQREFLELIRSESTAMSHLADDLLALASLDQGRPLAREPVDVGVLAREALRPFSVPPMTHRFQLLASADLPLIQADATLLLRAIANLIANAVKYARKRSPIRVHVFAHDGRLCVQVADEGIGLAPEDIKRLGEPFFRVHSEATKGIAGTGLGLALVWRIARAHGGDVTVESQPLQGTAVTVRLPLPEVHRQ